MQVGSGKLSFYFQLSRCRLETLNVIGFVKPMIREAKQGEVVFDFKTKTRLRSRFPCLIIRVKVVLDLGFVGPYVLMINPEGKVVARWHASNK